MKINNLLYILGILIICAAVGVSVLFYKAGQRERENILLLKRQIDEVTAQRINIVKKIKETEAEKERLQAQLEAYSERIEQLHSDISETRHTKDDLMKRVSDKEKMISDLNDKLNAVGGEESALNGELKKVKSDYGDIIRKIEAARMEKMALEENLSSRVIAHKGVELKKIVVKITPPVEGKVIEVSREYNFAIVDLGQRDNIKSGDLFGVYRNGELIAKAVAENIYEDMSSIIVLEEWSAVKILIKDTVRLLSP